MPRTPAENRVPAADAEAWEAYRLYQRDVLLGCLEDAELILRRKMLDATDEDRRMVLGLLWEKRCQPWKFFRDEFRAQRAFDLRQSGAAPVSRKAEG